MELKLLERIQKLGYKGELIDSNKFVEALKLGPKSTEFTKLVAWLTDEIAILNDIDETVHAIVSADDSSSFLLELSCFLKELGCVNERLMTGNVNTRLSNQQDRYILLDFLGAELKVSRLLVSRKLKTSNSMDVHVEESDMAKDLKDMLVALNFVKPPDDITADKVFGRMEKKLKDILKTVPCKLIGQSLITNPFTAKEWKDLQRIQEELHDEYRLRRMMLLQRLDVTVQSFLWSDRIKSQEVELKEQYEDTRKFLTSEPNITFADLLAVRDDIALMEKTSSASVRKNTKSKINSLIIGDVPDRGGRANEQEPPPPEMPPWQKDRVARPSTSREGHGGGGYRGGRGGGGSNTSFSNNNRGRVDSGFQSSNYSFNNSGFSGQGGGYGGKRGGGYSGEQGGGYGGSGGYGGNQRGYGGNQGGRQEGYSGNYGANQGGDYGGNHVGGYGGNQGGTYGGYQGGGYSANQSGGYGGNNSYSGDNREGGYNQEYQKGAGGGNRGGRGGRVQGGWNKINSNTDNYQRSGYTGGGGRGQHY